MSISSRYNIFANLQMFRLAFLSYLGVSGVNIMNFSGCSCAEQPLFL